MAAEVDDWRRIDVPGFSARTVTRHAHGLPLVGGSVDGRGVLLAFRSADEHTQVDLDGGPVISAASDGEGYTIGTADGQVLVGELDRDLDVLELGLVPVAVWATVADIDHRAVVAHDGPDGTELALWSGEQGLADTVPVPNRLFLRGGPVVVTSHQGVVVVAGPVDDGQVGPRPRAWRCLDPDFGGEPWREFPVDPPPDEFTGELGSSTWFYLAGHRDGRPLAWDEHGRAVDVPEVQLDAEHPVVLVADSSISGDRLVLALQSASGPQVWWREGAEWRSRDLPAGLLQAAAVTTSSDDWSGAELLAVVVGGAAYLQPPSGGRRC